MIYDTEETDFYNIKSMLILGNIIIITSTRHKES